MHPDEKNTASHEELFDFLASSLQDGKLSRGERKILTEVLADQPLSKKQRRALLDRASALAGRQLGRQQDRRAFEWLADVAKILAARHATVETPASEVLFAPDDPVAERIGERISAARRSLQLCVFTITDNHLTKLLLAAHGRGVSVRVITDDDKSLDQGSDIFRLERAGIPVRTDKDPSHMHHKFAILDQETLITGSYNWTFSAARHNRENLLISDDRQLLLPYQREFEKLWRLYDPGS